MAENAKSSNLKIESLLQFVVWKVSLCAAGDGLFKGNALPSDYHYHFIDILHIIYFLFLSIHTYLQRYRRMHLILVSKFVLRAPEEWNVLYIYEQCQWKAFTFFDFRFYFFTASNHRCKQDVFFFFFLHVSIEGETKSQMSKWRQISTPNDCVGGKSTGEASYQESWRHSERATGFNSWDGRHCAYKYCCLGAPLLRAI